MSDEQVIQEVATKFHQGFVASNDGYPESFRAGARALHAAGKLRTGLEQRAIAACEAYAKRWDYLTCWEKNEPGHVVLTIGRESLTAKQPKPRWEARQPQTAALGWFVHERTDNPPGAALWGPDCSPFTEAQARAVAETLNRLAAESPR